MFDNFDRESVKNWFLNNAAFVGLVTLLIVSSWLSPAFLTEQNISNVFRQWSMIGLIAIGLTFIIIAGGIDLSGGAILALATICGAMLAPVIGTIPMILAVLAIGTLCGFINGAIITWGGVTPFVATLGMMTIARGLALVLSDGRTLSAQVSPEFVFWFGRGYVGPVPAPVIVTAVFFLIAAFLLRATPYGRAVAMIGDNETAAYRCGINVLLIQQSVYTLHGFVAALAGLLFLGRLTVGEPTAGQLFELSAIAAVVIGGTSFSGGAGGVGLTFIGLMVIALTYNILNLLSVSPYAQDIARGVIIIVAVMFSIRSLRARR